MLADKHADHGPEEAIFRGDCIRNLTQYLQKHKRMSAAAAQDFISKRVDVTVLDVRHADDSFSDVKVKSQIKAAGKSNDSDVPSVTLEFVYHDQCGLGGTEHSCKLSYSMKGASGTVFRDDTFEPRTTGRRREKRSFSLTQSHAQKLQQTIFGDGWSILQAVLMCYAAAGVQYQDGNANLPSQAGNPVDKYNWLEQHTRSVCQVSTNDAEGNESEASADCDEQESDEDEDEQQFSEDEGWYDEEDEACGYHSEDESMSEDESD